MTPLTRPRWPEIIRLLAFGAASLVAMSPRKTSAQFSDSPNFAANSGETAILPTPVFTRPRPDYDPLGIHAGSFFGYPALKIVEEFDDNVYALGSNKISDFRTRLSPGLSVTSDWNRHALSFLANGDIIRYQSRVSENISDAKAAVSGRLDVTADDTLNGDLSYQLSHENRGSPDAVNGKTPTRYQLVVGDWSYIKQQADFQLRLDSTIDRYAYNNVASSTGAIINQTNRNREEYLLSPQIGYQYLPEAYAFLKAAGNVRSYDAQRDAAGFDRSSDGYLVAVGTGSAAGEKLSGNVYVGYSKQIYHDARLASSGGLAVSANALWNPTALTSVSMTAARTIEETTIAGSSSAQQLSLSLEVQHAFRDNLVGRIRSEFVQRQYQGVANTDNFSSITGEVKYYFNPNINTAVSYSFQNRSTPAIAGNNFTRNVFGLTFTAQL